MLGAAKPVGPCSDLLPLAKPPFLHLGKSSLSNIQTLPVPSTQVPPPLLLGQLKSVPPAPLPGLCLPRPGSPHTAMTWLTFSFLLTRALAHGTMKSFCSAKWCILSIASFQPSPSNPLTQSSLPSPEPCSQQPDLPFILGARDLSMSLKQALPGHPQTLLGLESSGSVDAFCFFITPWLQGCS